MKFCQFFPVFLFGLVICEKQIDSLNCFQKCSCLNATMNCSSNGLQTLPDHLPVDLKNYYLEHNRIKELRQDYFRKSKSVEKIILSNNQIEFIMDRQFENLEKLRHIDLEFNKIRYIGRNAFKGLYSIEMINLGNNHLRTFDESVGLVNNILRYSLKLTSNRLYCDCNLMWLVEKVKVNQLNLAAKCEDPDFLSGLPLNEPILPHLNTCSSRKISADETSYLGDERSLIKNVIIGDNTVLKCYVNNKEQDSRVQWYQNNQMINFNRSSKFHLLPNGSMIIRSLAYKDESVYTCKTVGNSLAYDLKVVETPIFTILPDRLYELNLGDSLLIKCTASANPNPIITWVNRSLNRNLTTGNQLYFQNINSSIDGNYQCIASNNYGYALSDFTINVRGGDLDSKPSNSLGFQSNSISDLFSNQDIEDAIEEAKLGVNQAINNTIKFILSESKVEFPLIEYKDQPFYSLELTNQNEQNIEFKRSNNQILKNYSPSRLMKIGRFPLNPNTIEEAKNREIFEKAIELLKRKAEMNHKFKTINFTYTDLLTTNQLNILNSLTGCLHGNRHHNLLKHNSCESKKKFNNCFRTIDGTCNNLKNQLNGAAMTPFKRLLQPIYEDGLHLPVGWLDNKLYNGFKLPNPRKVTLDLLSSINLEDDNKQTHLFMAIGQFIDHDLTFSLPSVSFSTFDRINSVDCQTTCSKTPPCYSIPLEENDVRKKRPHLLKNRNLTYSNCIELIRSSAFCGSGLTSINVGVLMPREQVNQLTSYLDLSQVYGSSPALALDLRELNDENGQLRFSRIKNEHFLPFNEKNRWPNDCQQMPSKSDFDCFIAGDVRSNEQIGLTVLHSLFLREHNRLATELKKLNNQWSGNRVYQEARRILIAKMQHITYDHWLRYVFGGEYYKNFLGEYKGYNESEDAAVSNVFATSALRFGHTLVQPFLIRLDENYKPHTKYKSKLNLFESFFAPHLIQEGGLEPILRGLLYQSMKKPSPKSVINHELTENLFELARHVSLDLASINIQRSREHGIPFYAEWREYCGLSRANTFYDLKNEIKNQTIRNKLADLYGHPSNIDLWVGSVLEEPLTDGKVGPTFACLLGEQFKRTRSADRFWYERSFTNEKLAEIKKSSLAELICLNTNIDKITEDVFLLPKLQSFVNCESISKSNLEIWKEKDRNVGCN